jgi:hypothetical protein
MTSSSVVHAAHDFQTFSHDSISYLNFISLHPAIFIPIFEFWFLFWIRGWQQWVWTRFLFYLRLFIFKFGFVFCPFFGIVVGNNGDWVGLLNIPVFKNKLLHLHQFDSPHQFPLSPMGVLAQRLRMLDHSLVPSGNLPPHVSAESPLNNSPNPSEVIS